MLLRAVVLALALTGGSVPALVAAQEEPQAAEQQGAQPDEGGEHAHGIGPMFANTGFIAAIINFALLLWVLSKVGKRPLGDFLARRRDEMARSMAAAAEMKAKAEAVFQEYSTRIAHLDEELAKLRQDIERAAEEDRQRIAAEAEDNARRLKRETEALIEQYGKALSADVRKEMVAAAIGAAENILRENISDADQKQLAERYDQEIRHDGRAEAPRQQASRPRTSAQEQP